MGKTSKGQTEDQDQKVSMFRSPLKGIHLQEEQQPLGEQNQGLYTGKPVKVSYNLTRTFFTVQFVSQYHLWDEYLEGYKQVVLH